MPLRFRATALAAALAACLPSVPAQALDGFDPTSPAVTGAYAGPATPDKLAAALAGLKPLLRELPLITPPGPCWFCGSGGVVIGGGGNWSGVIITTPPLVDWDYFAAPPEEYWVGSDADLSPLGEPALLAHTRLMLTGSFASGRDFVIGNPAYGPDYRPSEQFAAPILMDGDGNPSGVSAPSRPYDGGPGYIDTDWHMLKITGVVTSHQKLHKEGEGTLWLTGANVWNAVPEVRAGILKGDAASLDTAIVNRGLVEFHQQADGVYRHQISGGGALRKTGAGVLTLTAAQRHTGGTTVAEGTLALAEAGGLPGEGRLLVAAQGTLDLTGVGVEPVLRRLEGEGRVLLGERGLTLDIDNEYDWVDTSFAGALDGAGAVTVRGEAYALTGANSFSGGLNVVNTTLGVGQAASMGSGQVRLDAGTLRMLAPMHATQALRVDGVGNLDSDGHDVVWLGHIAGGGHLTKTGEGTLALRAANGFGGEVTVAAGGIKLSGAGSLDAAQRVTVDGVLDLAETDAARTIRRLEGSGRVLLGSAGMVLGADGDSSSFFGTLSGAGGITKVGTGEQALYGSNDYDGPTLVLAGTLRVAPQALGQRVVNQATLVFDQGGGLDGIAAWSGDIEGSGRVVKSGDGVLWLRGRNTHTGGTVVEQGVLIGNTASLPGDIETHAGLAFYQVADGTYAGRVSGGGSLLSYGPGALTLAGANTHTGGTAFGNTLRVARDENLGGPQSGLLIAGGTLQALDRLTLNRHVALGEAGARFDSNGHDIILNGRIDGPGGVTKLGEGVLFLAGEHGYIGPTRVEGGGMVVDGSFAGDVEVLSGAWFEAKGRVGGNLTVADGASFSAGNSPGRLTVDGDFLARGEILVELGGPQGGDFIQVGGQVELAGAHFRFVLLDASRPLDGGGLSFLIASGGITGLETASFDFDAGLAGYRVAQGGNNLYLAPVPEPRTWALLLAGLGLVGFAAGRRPLRAGTSRDLGA
jgi:autotransporter-associated beta strand protein